MLSLIASLFGPVFAKEMVEIARRKRYYFNRVFYGSVLLFATFVVWTNYSHRMRMGYNVANLMAEMGEVLFHVLSFIQYVAVYVFVPLFLCGVIASEREEKTLELLFTTELRDREIVLGKLASRVAVLIFLIFVALPIISIMMLFGGIEPVAVQRTLLATLLAIAYVSAHAIYFSAITKSALGALVRTYWWMAVWLIGIPLVVFPIASTFRSILAMQLASTVIYFINPIGPFAVGQFTDAYNMIAATATTPLDPEVWGGLAGTYNRVVPVAARWFFPLGFLFPLALSCVLIWRAVARLRVEPTPLAARLRAFRMRRRVQAGLPAEAAASVPRKTLGWLRAERTWYGREVLNPLWWRARVARVYDREGYVGRIQWLAWGIALFFFILFAIVTPNDMDEDEATMSFLACGYGLLLAMTALFAGSSLVGDRRRGFLDLVMVTPMTPKQIFDGTLLAIWQHLRRVVWLPVILGIVFAAISETSLVGLIASLVTALLFCALVAVYGVACSLLARTLPTALVLTVLFPVLFIAGTPFLTILLEELHGPVLLATTPVLFLLTWLLTRKWLNAATVGTFFMSGYLLVMSILMSWTWSKQHEEMPMAAFHPAFLAIASLEREPLRELTRSHCPWWLVVPLFWLGMIFLMIWMRWYVLHNFARIVERTDRPAGDRRQPGSIDLPAALVQPVEASNGQLSQSQAAEATPASVRSS